MNAEYLWWFVILVAVGVGVVLYLALGPVPEIPPADQSSPVSTTEPGSGEPSSTSETP